MLAGFDWWLLILGIVGGGGLVWLLLAEFRRTDADVAADESAREAEWIAAEAATDGRTMDVATVERVLALHRAYLGASAPDTEAMDDAAWYDAHPAGSEDVVED